MSKHDAKGKGNGVTRLAVSMLDEAIESSRHIEDYYQGGAWAQPAVPVTASSAAR